MTIRCKLKLVMATENLKRATSDEAPITLRRLARETGLALSSLSDLASNRSRRVDYKTLDYLCAYFDIDVGELITR